MFPFFGETKGVEIVRELVFVSKSLKQTSLKVAG